MVVQVFGRSTGPAATRETARLAALEQIDMLDAPRDKGFDRIVRLIKEIFGVEIGLVTIIDAHRQWYLACSGFGNDEVPRQDTFCRYVIDDDEPLVVEDATRDARFAAHPAVAQKEGVRFYAGVPIKTAEGQAVGTLCAIDRRPRSFGNRELRILQELAGAAMDRIELLQFASTDGLTGALTRRAFRDQADQLVSAALMQGYDLSCIVLDVDYFKQVNDTYGHAVGDDVLRTVAAISKTTLGPDDLVGRLGGEEFAFVLPRTDQAAACEIAARLREAIEGRSTETSAGSLKITASFGITSLSIAAKNIETLLAQADAAMYKAKREGRNRCVAWNEMRSEFALSSRRRVLKAGAIIFNDRRSVIDCTVRALGSDGAGLSVSNSAGVPAEFVLAIRSDGLEMYCRVISQDRQHIEVAFA